MTLSRSKFYIAIDPAQAGSCVCLSVTDNGKAFLIFAVSWKKVSRQKRRVYKVDVFDHLNKITSTLICDHPAMISNHICTLANELAYRLSIKIEDIDFRLSIEDAYIGKSARTGIGIAKFAGRLMGVLEAYFNKEAQWVRAGDWRKVVLNLPYFTKRDLCKKASLDGVPLQITGLDLSLKELGRLDHITDAGGIGLWNINKEP